MAGGDFGGAPIIPDGAWSYGFYDAVNYSDNRAARPFFATDSRYTLTQWSRLRGMSLARWAYINIPFVKGAVDLMARLTVGTGFAPRTACGDQGLADAADAYTEEGFRNIGFMAGEPMDELLLHDCRCSDVDGDKLDILVDDEFDNLKLQFIEGHRIRTGDVKDPHCRDGVWIDKYGRRVAYQVAIPGDDAGASRRIQAKDAIYLAERNRPDETRSMTNLIHALAPLQDLYEILGFAMTSAKKNTEFAALIETPTPNDPPGVAGMYSQQIREAIAGNGGAGQQPQAGASFVTREQVWAGGGKMPTLRPGEKLASYQHAQPAPEIAAWAAFIIRGIAVGYGVPFEVLWNPEAIGGANTRLITALLRGRLVQRRNFLIFPKLTRTRYAILCRGIRKKVFKVNDLPKLLPHTWQPKFSDVTVDAGRESKERRANVQAGLDTYTNYFAENGETYADEVRRRGSDLDWQCQEAAAACKKYPGLDFQTALLHIASVTPSGREVIPGQPPTPF